MDALRSMRNIGEEMEKKLHSVGIDSPEQLAQAGSKEAFFRMKLQYSNLCLVHLYTLEAAITGVDLNALSKETKADLKQYAETIK